MEICNWKIQTLTQKGFNENYNFFSWCYEDELPEMSDKSYDNIFPFSEVKEGVRMFPYLEDINGDIIFIGFV